jgi:glycosyltransferase involved in cell wall biosynthesis
LEIIAIDGGSTDGTAEYLESQNIRVVRQKVPSLNAAYHELNSLAQGQYIMSFFPKGTLPVDDLYKFEQFFLNGYELVIASRNLRESVNEEDEQFIKIRKWGVFCLSTVSSILWRKSGNKIHDVLHGFKGWSRKKFDEMNLSEVGVTIDLEMVVRSYRMNLNRIEFPTHEGKRFYGQTNFKVFPTGIRLLKFLISEVRKDCA